MPQTKQILKKVKKIEIKTKHLVDGLLQGAYHSIFKGQGIEFSEVREYVPGDDIRTIDWNVTARMNQPFVKEFIEERDLTVYIVLDVSASNEFGSEKSKKQAAIELAASLMFAALRNNDRVGLSLFTKEVEKLNNIPEYDKLKPGHYNGVYMCSRCITELFLEYTEVIQSLEKKFP